MPSFNRAGFYKEVGVLMQMERRARGMTQQEVADAIGVPRATYANIERGRQRVAVDVLWRISVVFGVPMDRLAPEAIATEQVSQTAVDFYPIRPKST
jgi:transcriptional regulator with XRE-family HTH domain